MFKFQKDQSSFAIGVMMFGGQPGKRPPVLVGSIFYPDHSIVIDRKEGRVDTERLSDAVSAAESLAERLHMGHALAVFMDAPSGVHGLLSAAADCSNGALFLDSSSQKTKRRALEEAESAGISDRVVYNSLHIGSPEDEWSSLRDHGVDSAVISAFDPGDITVKGRIHLLDNGGSLSSMGLVDKAALYGIKKPLLDLATTSYEQRGGAALRAIMLAKAKWGLPSGCSLHNTVETWPPVTQNADGFARHVDSSSVAITVMSGADWLMYGPLEASKRCLYSAAFASSMMEQSAYELW